MIELIKEWFEFVAKQNWLNHINRAADRYYRLDRKAQIQAYVVHKLVARYNELYPSDKIKMWQKEARHGQKKADQQAH
ncbi:MAG: hypothetical protein K2O18_16440 [Oscillospiraceae bacterium]|nr:hypothetical protein [Oscillospiraceae bacterium]